MTDLPCLALGALGGTLSMETQPDSRGIAPTVGAQAWAERLPMLARLARLRVHTLCLVPSPSLDFEQLAQALSWAREQALSGAQGVVISQGTDTLEEAAYWLDLQWDQATPLVLTGAMRGADQPSCDGPANLLDAARVAIDQASRQRGVLVVMNQQVFLAKEVRKTHSLSQDAFSSPVMGPTGEMVEGQVRYHRTVETRPVPLQVQAGNHRVALLEATLGQDPWLLEAVCHEGLDGLVVAGFGAGHVPGSWADRLEHLAKRMPVIVASRTGAGCTAYRTYGFPGGEIDLQKRGILMGGSLCPRKCRLLILALLGAGAVPQLAERLRLS